MYAPNVLLLWALLTLAALMIATGTLALLAIFGSIGQLLAMILLIYLSIASAGGTVPIQALPGILQTIGHVEPLRNTLLGTRAILYFGARGDAGLTTSIIVLACRDRLLGCARTRCCALVRPQAARSHLPRPDRIHRSHRRPRRRRTHRPRVTHPRCPNHRRPGPSLRPVSRICALHGWDKQFSSGSSGKTTTPSLVAILGRPNQQRAIPIVG